MINVAEIQIEMLIFLMHVMNHPNFLFINTYNVIYIVKSLYLSFNIIDNDRLHYTCMIENVPKPSL